MSGLLLRGVYDWLCGLLLANSYAFVAHVLQAASQLLNLLSFEMWKLTNLVNSV